jgi:hypothetical protein
VRESDVGNPLTCDAVDMHDTVARYVSGHLTEDAAAAFEQHLEGCERCWAEVQLALQVRAATRRSEVHGPKLSRRRAAHQQRWFAAAAAAVVLAISGWWILEHRERATEVTRGGAGISIAANRLSQGSVRLSWASIEGALRYRVAVSRADGTPLLTRDTDRPELLLGPSELPAPPPTALLLEVRAEDALGTPLAAHGPVLVPISGPVR